jgi:hypothetical protein
MKKNHEQVELLIRNAIAACGYDAAFSETKRYLSAALQSTQKVSKKRSRSVANEKHNQEVKTYQEKWWEMIKRNNANYKVEDVNYKENQ